MDLDIVNTDAVNPSGAAEESGCPGHVCYTEPAPLVDVMFEQLDYLVSHESSACSPGCPDCARLAHVRNWLLEPFRPASTRCPAAA
ncbi:MAG TPA: hypothetical protein VGH38_38080 [Bryobacteraceae bacterium]